MKFPTCGFTQASAHLLNIIVEDIQFEYLNFADSTTAVVVISMMGRFFVTFSVNTVMQQVPGSMQIYPRGFF